MTDHEARHARPPCLIPSDKIVVLYPGVSSLYTYCDFPEGTTFRFYYSERGKMDTDQTPVKTQPPEPTHELIVHPSEPTAPVVDPAQLQQIGAENPYLAIALAVIAVLGGGAAWKHYAKRSEQKHEQAMKELELRAQMQTAQPPPCQAADAATKVKLSEIETRLGSIEKKQLSVGSLPNDLEERIESLEQSLKRKEKK